MPERSEWDEIYEVVKMPPADDRLGWSVPIWARDDADWGKPVSKNGNPYHPVAHAKGMVGTLIKQGSTDSDVTRARKTKAQYARAGREKVLKSMKASRTAIRKAQNEMFERALQKVEHKGEAVSRLERCFVVLEDIMVDEEVDARVRVTAAETYLNRMLGKPSQEVHHEGGDRTVLQILMRAQELNRARDERRIVENTAVDAGSNGAGDGPDMESIDEPGDRGSAALPGRYLPGPGDWQEDPQDADEEP